MTPGCRPLEQAKPRVNAFSVNLPSFPDASDRCVRLRRPFGAC